MHELQLAVNLSGWRIFVGRQRDKAFTPVAQRVLDRDAYVCQYCGFQAKEFQDIVNVDGNYRNNKFSNLATACCFCSQCLFLQAVGLNEKGGGQLIYLPEISQNDLNSLCHVLFCAMESNTAFQESAQAIYRSLRFRSQVIENHFGSGTSQPAVMGQLMIEYESESKDKKKLNILEKMRLLPSHTKFKMQLDAWSAAAVAELAEQEANAT